MADVQSRVIDQFQTEHRDVRDRLLTLSDAIEGDDLESAQETIGELNQLTGPHFRYEEEALYPALVEFFGKAKVRELVEEHDEAIEKARTLLDVVQKESLSAAERESALRDIVPLLVHVSDCEGLTVYVEKMPRDALEDIRHSMDIAEEEGIPLLEYDDTLRGSPTQMIP